MGDVTASDYDITLELVKQRITNARYRALRSINRELVSLYRDIGRIIIEKQRVHERIGNKRYYFVHQLSRKLVDDYGFIAFEDLDVKGMVRNRCVSKSISDATWNMLITATGYKAASAGTTVVLVNPANTSKLCSRCGMLVDKELKDRVHECPVCGLVIDRDQNAAVNILRPGLQSVAKA
jgi:putative transposase